MHKGKLKGGEGTDPQQLRGETEGYASRGKKKEKRDLLKDRKKFRGNNVQTGK